MFGKKKSLDKHSLCISAIAKNEAMYISEWLAHYRNIGVTHFFIADNGSNDGTQEILAQEALVGDITWESWTPPVNAQIKWYEECLLRYRYQCKWMGFFDIDEFLIDSQSDNIISKLTTLLEQDVVGGVAINWRIFGSARFKRAQPGAVTSRFNMASRLTRIVNQHVKCIVKPQAISKVYVHAPKLKSGYCYIFSNGNPVSFVNNQEKTGQTQFVCKNGLILNHYNIKSEQEFIDIKSSRGRANLGPKKSRDLEYFYNHDINDEIVETCNFDVLKKNNYNELPRKLIRKKPFWFIHIPKTAGTSFRLGAITKLGKNNVWNDYGENSKETHPVINRCIYELKDGFELNKKIRTNNVSIIVGHVPANRYISVAGIRNSFTFLRDPLQRIISDYKHFVRHGEYKGSLESFIERPALQNRQSGFLAGARLEAYGVIGITERYKESLDLINYLYSMDIPYRIENVEKEVGCIHSISDVDLDRISELNDKDLRLYSSAVQIFSQRIELHNNCLPYAHGALQKSVGNAVFGWAWWSLSDDPVELEIFVDDILISRAVACDHRPGLIGLSPPRDGYVGFSASLGDLNSSGRKVSCRVAMTGQIIDTLIL